MPGLDRMASDVVQLDQVKDFLELSLANQDPDTLLREIIHAVSVGGARWCGRESFMSATYTHDSSTRSLLSGDGTSKLFLPNTPVQSITDLRPNPNYSATLSQGWNEAYDFDPWEGIVELRNGDVFAEGARTVYCTYVGGYVPWDGAVAATKAEFGIVERASDLILAMLEQIGEAWNRRKQKKSGTVSFATAGGGTFNFAQKPLLDSVRQVWESYRHVRL
jgi:hypothetical protein